MNDLRSTSRAIEGGDDESAGISSTPPRVRPERIAERGAQKKMSRRQSIAERARQEAVAKSAAVTDDGTVDAGFHDDDHVDDTAGIAMTDAGDPSSDIASESSEASGDQALFDDELLNAKLARRAARRGKGQAGPDSRPTRRRELDDDEDAHGGEDRFPWHFQFDEDDEPEELQASTPLLSRAFRATTG